MVFVIQSNRYSYSTPVARQMVNTNIAQRIYGGWSIPAERVDGTDALAVLDTVRAAVERARNGNGPQAVEALSVRMHGHAAHDDARYVPAGMREEFADRYDPVEPARRPARARRLRQPRDRRDARGGRRRGRRRSGRGRAGAGARPRHDRGRRLRSAAVPSLVGAQRGSRPRSSNSIRTSRGARSNPNRVPAAGGGTCGRRRSRAR